MKRKATWVETEERNEDIRAQGISAYVNNLTLNQEIVKDF